ncbi:3-methyl-2-oxobutanoate hydroxymethyltransferase 1, mitochondrial [Phytophthora ramorum]|uniref:3-methyl-2-oxobutanoate hydroxymethyltransferase 1, mitochondrial n=1 Tax=Phytophthora ramorum TaxID=164328 RepID=UPI0030AA7552|nr:3-methyl-2-oxobutanoate hydroxymethyltransferase 1, mitochondrial [Phytophthora ramorum]
MKEGGADSVKVEGDKERPKTNKDNIKTIIDGGIAVTGHIGLRSQHTSVLEGLRAQGCTSIQARRFIEDALAVQKADLVLQCAHYHYGACTWTRTTASTRRRRPR